jgi:hypothetical protein
LPLIFPNATLIFVPDALTPTMMTTLIIAAISPYSIAVAPDVSRRNRAIQFFMIISPSACRLSRSTKASPLLELGHYGGEELKDGLTAAAFVSRWR